MRIKEEMMKIMKIVFFCNYFCIKLGIGILIKENFKNKILKVFNICFSLCYFVINLIGFNFK